MSNERNLDTTLEGVFQQAFEMTPEREQHLHRRILDRREDQGQAWDAFTRVMIGLQAQFRQGFDCLSFASRLAYAANRHPR